MKNNILVIDTTNPEKTAILLGEHPSTSSLQPRRLKSGGVRILAKKIWWAKTHQSEELLPEIEKILKRSKANTQNLGLIIVNVGPGSFTGTRVGVATANAFGFGFDIPVVGIRDGSKKIEEIFKEGLKSFQKTKQKKGDIARPYYEKPPNITKSKIDGQQLKG